jgi:putative nucleotidyltransferase with HDIG domain
MKEITEEDAFVMGLLHDIGKAVLFQHFPDSYSKVLTEAAEKEVPLHEMEQQMMKIDHAEVGGVVADSWDLPKPLVRAIQYHHSPADADEGSEGFLANLANYYAHHHKAGSSGTPTHKKPSPFALPAVGHDGDLDTFWTSLELDVAGLRGLLPSL